ncbi:MAG TPA: 23S rRNA methyltransferase [Actinoplanes sp.]|jgi:23S rRNA (guanine745-N1)-methyltransferase
MNSAAWPYLRCPVCGDALDGEAPGSAAPGGGARTLRCPRRHSFDIARQGYVDLSAGRTPHSGDTAAMVAARADFLAAGHYDVITTALVNAALATDVEEGLVLDAGTGTGWHLAGVLDALPEAVGLGLDVSKPALRRAARAHPRAGAALTDLWRPLPVRDGAAALVLNVFAPRNGPEFRRVLRPDGTLLVVTPATEHLTELVTGLDLLRVDPDKAGRVAGSLGDRFTATATTTHRQLLRLTRAEVHTLVGMGPSAWHADAERMAADIAALPVPVTATVAVDLTVYRIT